MQRTRETDEAPKQAAADIFMPAAAASIHVSPALASNWRSALVVNGLYDALREAENERIRLQSDISNATSRLNR